MCSLSQDLEKVKSLKMKPLIIAGPTVRPREFLNTFGDVLDLFWLKARDLQVRLLLGSGPEIIAHLENEFRCDRLVAT